MLETLKISRLKLNKPNFRWFLKISLRIFTLNFVTISKDHTKFFPFKSSWLWIFNIVDLTEQTNYPSKLFQKSKYWYEFPKNTSTKHAVSLVLSENARLDKMCTLYNKNYTLYKRICTLYSRICTLYSSLCRVHSIICTFSVQ